jgi:hypothetical protein
MSASSSEEGWGESGGRDIINVDVHSIATSNRFVRLYRSECATMLVQRAPNFPLRGVDCKADVNDDVASLVFLWSLSENQRC